MADKYNLEERYKQAKSRQADTYNLGERYQNVKGYAKKVEDYRTERADELDKLNTPSDSRLLRAAYEKTYRDDLDSAASAVRSTLPQRTDYSGRIAEVENQIRAGATDMQTLEELQIARERQEIEREKAYTANSANGVGYKLGAGFLGLMNMVNQKSDQRKAVADNAKGYIEEYTANRDAAQTEEERKFWQARLDNAQAEYDNYYGREKSEAEQAEEDLLRKASEGSYNARASKALKTAEKYGTAENADTFGGRLSANYGVGRLSQNLNYAANEYLDSPTAENKQLMDLYRAAIENAQVINADALATDNKLEEWEADIAGYLPQRLDQAGARVKGGAIGALLGSANIGQAAASAADMYKITRGGAFLGLVDAGVPEDVAKEMVNDEALISSIIEYADSLAEYAFLGGKEVVGLLLGGGLEKVGTTAAKAKGRQVLQKLAAYGLNILQEGEEERSQEAVSIANERRYANGETASGPIGLAKSALDVYVNEGLLGADSEAKKRMEEAAQGGRRIAAVFGAAQAGSGYLAGRSSERLQRQAQQRQVEQILQQASQEIAENAVQRPAEQVLQQAAEEAAGITQAEQTQAPESNFITEESKPAEAQETAKNESFEQAAKRVLGKEGAKAAIEAYDGSVPSDRYLGAWLTYYMRGVSGNEIDTRYAGDLTPEQAGKAYQSGVADAKASLERDKRASQFASVAGDDSGLVFDDYVNGMDSAVADVINLVAKKLGLRVRFVDKVEGGRANAQISGNEVLIEKNNPNPTAFLYGHEITHRMQELAPEEYRAFRDSLGDEVKAVAQVKMDRFGYTYEEALDEAAADYAGRLINDDRLLDKFIADHRDDRNLLQKLVDAIRELIGRLTDSAEQKKLRAAEQKLTAAYNAAAEQAEKLTAKENTATDDGGWIRYNKKSESNIDPETASIKEQIALHADELNAMDEVIASINVPTSLKSRAEAVKWATDLFKPTGYSVDRQGYGVISFSENDIVSAMKYANTPEERAAIAALPRVLKRGIEIGRHTDHKGRKKGTITFGAPVELNGVRGNMGVVVNRNGDRYYAHRIVMPNGAAFVFSEEKENATPTASRGVAENGSLAKTIGAASSTENVAQKEPAVKKNSLKDARDLYRTEYDFTKPMTADEFREKIRDEAKAERYMPKGLSKEFLDAISRKSLFTRTKLYRGMDASEFDYLAENGFLRSNGSYNFGNQQGQTLSDEDPGYALGYATGFAPKEIADRHYKGDMQPSYLVEFINSPDLNMTKNQSQESYTYGDIDQKYITRVFEIEYDPKTKQDMVTDVTNNAAIKSMLPEMGKGLSGLAHGAPEFYRDKTTGTRLYAVQGADGYENGQYISEKDPSVAFTYDMLDSPAMAKHANAMFGVSGKESDLERMTVGKDGKLVSENETVLTAQKETQESAERVNVNYDEKSESANAIRFSRKTWNESDYVTDTENAAKDLSKALGISVKKAKKFISEVNSIAKIIADDRERLDYEAAPYMSSFVSNAEYGGSIDFSTICKKRRVLTGTLEAIQQAMPDKALTADEVLKIRDMMQSRGYEVSCGLCYVEGSRAKMGGFAKQFINLFKKYNPDAEWIPDMYDVNTPTGVEQMRLQHKDVYEQYEYFWNHHGRLRDGDPNLFASQQKPKLYQTATEYRGEILQKFKNADTVAQKNLFGGLRLQSFSDFEIIHLLDTMQVITDMSRVGLAGQAYTKVPDFAWAVGGTGLKVNLSLIAKGVDENGRVILDEVEGMKRADAEALRNAYSKNVGTILVVFDDAQLKAAMNDPFIDFIIPFHRSQWAKKYYDILGLPKSTKDYTRYQNEKMLAGGKKGNLMPNEYWDFSKSGKENAERYLALCAEMGKRPKFRNLLVDNGDGSWSLQPDGSTDGYWKLLIDFKMYDNKGKGSPQMPVTPQFNMTEAKRMLQDYNGGHEQFPVAQDVVDDFVGGRFSEKGSENDFEIARLRTQNDALRERVDYWRGQTKRTVNPTVRAADTKRMAREIVKAYSATAKADDIGARLQALGNYIVQGGDKTGELNYSTLKERAVEIARDVINSAEELNDEYADVYREIRSRAKNGIKVSDTVRSDIPDFELWRKDHFGDLTVSDKGVLLDSLYEEMADIAPWLFPEANGGDQLLRIADAIDNLRPVYENPHSYDMAAAIEYCANDIIDGLLGENVRQTPKTFADRQAAKLDEAKAEGRRRVAEVREQKNAQIERLREQNRAAVEQAVKRERARRGEMLQNLKDHYKEIENRKRERRADSAARTKLLNIAKRLKNKKLPAVTRDLLNQYIGDLDTASKGMTGKTVEKLSELEDWYLDQKENNPDFISDPRIENALRRLHSKHIADMSAEDVADLTDILLNIENEIRTQREAIDSKMRHDTYVAGVEAMRDIENSGGLKGGMFDKLFINNTLSPVREMHRLTGYNDSDPLYVLTQELADGQRKMFDYQRRASERFKRWTENKKFVDRVRGKNAEEMKIAGIGADGPVEVSITPAMRMSLYLHSKNDQNLRHIAGGGITVPDMKLYKQGKIEEAYNKGTKIKLTPSQVRSITAGMSAEERAFADAASAYFNGMSRDAINETSEKLKGYSIAGVENYFPIDTDKSFVKKDFDALKFDGTLEGMGFLKERINASSPIMLYDLDRVLRRSIDQHSKYVGLAIPVRNFNKVWGVNKSSFDADGNRNSFESSVQQKMKQMWDDAGYKYVENLMSDLQNGYSEQDDFDKWLRKVRSNYAGAVLTLNASVAMKQAASYPTAAAVVGWKPLAKALRYAGRVDTDLVNKYTPLLWYRSQGFSTQELGDMAKQDRQLPKLLNWVQGMDLLTTKTLWKAAEFYVQDEMKVKRGSDGFYPAVADVYNRIIEETQPNYTTMQRPQLLRTENTLLQSLSMFKTQPFQNFNVLYDALGNLDAKRRAAINGGDMDAYRDAQKQARRAVSSQVVQLAVFAGMTAAWNLFRGKTDKYDDDDENVTAASVLRRIGHDMLGSAASMIPFGSDVWEMLNGWLGKDTYYGFDEITSSSINDLVNAVSKAGKSLSSMFESAANGEEIDFDTQRKTWDSVLKAASKVAGVPYENVENLFNAVYRKAAIAAGGRYKGQYAYLKLTAGKSSDYYNNLYDAYKNDKAAYEEIYADMLKDGYTVDKIKSAMETRMKTDAGVTSVNDLDDRFLSPEQQTKYDSELAAIEGTSVWRVANDRAKENTLERLYELAAGTSDGRKLQEKIDGGASVGLSDTEYLLYTAALDTVDKPTDSGKYGTFTQDEIAAAIRAVPGLTSKERRYLWKAAGKSEESCPW